MSRAVRCLECFRRGPVPPWNRYGGSVPDTLTERQRRNNLATFDELDPNLVLHIALTAHNEWDHLSARTGQWEDLGAYLGDGYFEADTERV